MMSSTESDQVETTLDMSGPMTQEQVVRWHLVLREALDSGGDLRIDLGMSGPWDLSGLQLMLSTMASVVRAGVRLRLINVPRVFETLAERAGLTEEFLTVTESRLD